MYKNEINELDEIIKVYTMLCDDEMFDVGDSLADLGVDSLDMLNLMADIEVDLGVFIKNEDFAKVETVGDLHELVIKCLSDAE